MVTGFSIQKFAYFLISLVILVGLLYLGRPVILPLVFGVFFALMLNPVCNFWERWLRYRVLSIVLTLVTVGTTIAGILLLFVTQLRAILTEADDIVNGFSESMYELTYYLTNQLGYNMRETDALIEDGLSTAAAAPLELIGTGLSSSTVFLANAALVLIYTFLFLLYRTAIKRFFMGQFPADEQGEGLDLLKEIQKMSTSYLGGMGIVMVILAVLNTVGLYFIGIDYYFIFGLLAAFLAVIPYVGTTIGGVLPFLFAIATTETVWQPVAVVVLYTSVQFIEGNLITPKVVGNSVKVNALAAIIALIFGALIWGISGVILAIPIVAVVRIAMNHVTPLKPFALLLSDDLYDHSDKFLTDYNAPQYRLSSVLSSNLFRTKSRLVKKPARKVGEPDPEVIPEAQTQ